MIIVKCSQSISESEPIRRYLFHKSIASPLKCTSACYRKEIKTCNATKISFKRSLIIIVTNIKHMILCIYNINITHYLMLATYEPT